MRDTQRRLCAERARDLQDASRPITLDGKPARISGFENDFATVWDKEDQIRSAQWAWQTVVKIITEGGDFRSR